MARRPRPEPQTPQPAPHPAERPPDAATTPDGEHPSYEQAVEELEAIIDRIESGEISLEESMTAYERGIALVRRCRDALARAEQRIEELSSNTNDEPNASQHETPAE